MMEEVVRIDDEIAALEKQIIQLKTRRNACMPLCRLPTELVRRILQLVQFAPDERHDPFACQWLRHDVDVKWMRVVRVCSWLRGIALGTPELWAAVDLDALRNVRALEGYSERAAGQCLTLWSRRLDTPKQAVRWMLDRLPMLETAHVAIGAERYMDAILPALASNGPALSSLGLIFQDEGTMGVDFLGATREHITHLSLARIWLAARPPHFPALTHLSLSEHFTNRLHADLRKLLAQTPLLEELCLSHADIRAYGDVFDLMETSPSPLALPALRVVRANYTTAWHLFGLLHTLPVPKSQMRVHLKDGGPMDRPRAHTGIASKIMNFWTRAHGEDVSHGVLSISLRPETMDTDPPGIRFSMRATGAAGALSTFEVVLGSSQVAMEVYGPHVRTLHVLIRGDGWFSGPDAQLWADSMPALRELVLEDTAAATYAVYNCTKVLSWLAQRTSAGRGVETVRFLNCAQARKEALIAQIRSQFSGDVVWTSAGDDAS
jgi:hypothetical protein